MIGPVLQFIVGTMLAFTMLGLACAAWFGIRRKPAIDPYLTPIGYTPALSAEQLNAICRRRRMTPDEQELQRRSFVYANCRLSNPLITRAIVDHAAESAGLALRPDATSGRLSIPSREVAGRTHIAPSNRADEWDMRGRNV